MCVELLEARNVLKYYFECLHEWPVIISTISLVIELSLTFQLFFIFFVKGNNNMQRTVDFHVQKLYSYNFV